MDDVKAQAQTALKSVDKGLDTASQSVLQYSQQAIGSSYQYIQQGQGVFKDFMQEYSKYEQEGFKQVKESVVWGVKNYHISIPTVLGVGCLVLPGPRAILYSRTIGALSSEESIVSSVRHMQQTISGATKVHQGEGQKLENRLQEAQRQYTEGQSKLRNTKRQLENLQSTLKRNGRNTEAMLAQLRMLRSRDAFKLRAETADTLSMIKAQKAQLENTLYKLQTQGF